MSFLKSSHIIKRRIVFALLATSLVAGSVVSLFANDPMAHFREGGTVPVVAQAGESFVFAKQQVTPENMKLMLLRIALLYGAFICILGALDTGNDASEIRP